MNELIQAPLPGLTPDQFPALLARSEDPALRALSHAAQRSERVAQYLAQFFEHCAPLFAQRNAQYGDSTRETGVLGAAVELVAKQARMRELVLRRSDHGRGVKEEVRDTARDMVNYGLITLIWLELENWEGIETELSASDPQQLWAGLERVRAELRGLRFEVPLSPAQLASLQPSATPPSGCLTPDSPNA